MALQTYGFRGMLPSTLISAAVSIQNQPRPQQVAYGCLLKMGLIDLCGEWLVDLLNMLCVGCAVPPMKSRAFPNLDSLFRGVDAAAHGGVKLPYAKSERIQIQGTEDAEAGSPQSWPCEPSSCLARWRISLSWCLFLGGGVTGATKALVDLQQNGLGQWEGAHVARPWGWEGAAILARHTYS